MRRIHWRQTARTGKLSVIEFEKSQATNLVIALDLEKGTEVGEGDDTTLEYGVRLAATLAQQAIEQGTSVRLLLPELANSDTSGMLAAATRDGRGQSHVYLILDALARVEANSAMSLHQLVEENAVSVQPGTTLLIITAKPDTTLSASFAPYLAIGVKIGLAYVDPASFLMDVRRES